MSGGIPLYPTIPDRLRLAAKQGTLIPFISAGVSQLGGCPGWDEFANATLRFFVQEGKLSHAQLDQMSSQSARVKLAVALWLEQKYGLPTNELPNVRCFANWVCRRPFRQSALVLKGVTGLRTLRSSLFALAIATIPLPIVAACPVPPVNVPSEDAKKLAINKLGQLLVCSEDDPLNDQSPCNTFASKGLEAIYGVIDFKTAPNAHMSANQIADKVSVDGKWKLIGPVLDDQNALCAQAASNSAYPVVAVMKGKDHGHIALVIPGEPKQASSWGNKLAVNSASFFLGKPSQVYINGPLNKAFGQTNAEKAVFYYRIKE